MDFSLKNVGKKEVAIPRDLFYDQRYYRDFK